jgi:hypothetical protein
MRESRRLVAVLPPPAVRYHRRLGAAQHPGSQCSIFSFADGQALWAMARQMQKLENCPQDCCLAVLVSSDHACLFSVSYTTAVCVKAHTFYRFLLYSMETIESLMHADKDLFIRGYFFFMCNEDIFISSK